MDKNSFSLSNSRLPSIQAPDFSFKPSGSVVDTGPAQVALQQQRQQSAQQQQDLDNILRTANLASELAQTFVEASKRRQQQDAISAYLAFKPNASVPEDAQKQRQLLSGVGAAYPQEAAKQILDQALPSHINSSFGGLIPVVNAKTGERSFVQADKNGAAKLINGQPYTPEWQREYAPSVVTDPVSGQNLVVPKTPGLAPTPVSSGLQPGIEPGADVPYHRRSIKEKSEISGIVKDLTSDDLLQTSERALNTVGNLKSVLDQDLTVASGAIKSLASRVIAGEKGVLTDRDVERQLGTDYANKFSRLIRGAYDGKLTDQDYRELQTILEQTSSRAAEQYQNVQTQNIESLQTQYGLSDKEAKTLLKYRDPSKVLAIQAKREVKDVNRELGVTKPTDQSISSMSDEALDKLLIEAETKLRKLDRRGRK